LIGPRLAEEQIYTTLGNLSAAITLASLVNFIRLT